MNPTKKPNSRTAGTVRLLVCSLALLLFPEISLSKPISIATIGDDPTDEIRRYLPLANYLAKQLEADGYDQGKVVVVRSIREMAGLLKEGKTDLYIDSPFPVVATSRLSGSKFLVLREKKGLREYHSVIFVRQDSGIQRLQDLNGKIIAFKESFSSSGYFVPKMVMSQQGLKLAPKADAADPVSPREVGYVFSSDDENSVAWVVRNKVMAAALDNQSYEHAAKANPNRLRILHQTFSFPRHIVSHRASLPVGIVEKIKTCLLQMHQSEEGRKTLQEFQQTTRFDELPSQVMAPFLNAGKLIDAELRVK